MRFRYVEFLTQKIVIRLQALFGDRQSVDALSKSCDLFVDSFSFLEPVS